MAQEGRAQPGLISLFLTEQNRLRCALRYGEKAPQLCSTAASGTSPPGCSMDGAAGKVAVHPSLLTWDRGRPLTLFVYYS